jgi:hypothetical protein
MVSLAETFQFSAQYDNYNEVPQYDDNGDGISNPYPIPAGGDGDFGATVYLTVQTSGPVIQASPESLDFGSVVVDSVGSRTMTIANTGGETLNLQSIQIDNPYFAIVSDPTPTALVAGSELNVVVEFSPTDIGSAVGVITITSDADNNPELEVSLTGVGVPEQSAELSVGLISDEPDNNAVNSRISLRNESDRTLDLTDVFVLYYTYDPDASINEMVWDYYYCNLGQVVDVEIVKMDTPADQGAIKADTRIEYLFDVGTVLSAGQEITVNGAVRHQNWSYDFDETDDWSYQVSDENRADNIVVVNGAGQILWGNSPE